MSFQEWEQEICKRKKCGGEALNFSGSIRGKNVLCEGCATNNNCVVTSDC
jgi:hypothetical protein